MDYKCERCGSVDPNEFYTHKQNECEPCTLLLLKKMTEIYERIYILKKTGNSFIESPLLILQQELQEEAQNLEQIIAKKREERQERITERNDNYKNISNNISSIETNLMMSSPNLLKNIDELRKKNKKMQKKYIKLLEENEMLSKETEKLEEEIFTKSKEMLEKSLSN